jgi:hypothetical protein
MAAATPIKRFREKAGQASRLTGGNQLYGPSARPGGSQRAPTKQLFFADIAK